MENNILHQRCGDGRTASDSVESTPWTLNIHQAVGQNVIQVQVRPDTTVADLKKLISKRCKIGIDRLNVVFKERNIVTGTIVQNGISDGSRLDVIVALETGLVSKRPEPNSSALVQALENLTEHQINTFLSGQGPLLLSIRVGAHMMYIQLELTVSLNRGRQRRNAGSGSSTSSSSTPSRRCSEGPSFTSPTIAPHLHTNRSKQTLAEATRSLSQKLKHLSQVTLPAALSTCSKGSSVAQRMEAVIDSMQHQGQGIYSGTFSGTLSPALQDASGNPKRSFATIVHILNDLLSSHSTAFFHNHHHASPPSSPKDTTAPAGPSLQSNIPEPTVEQLKLRNNMQRIREMLAERKNRRRGRRPAPYPKGGSPVSCGMYEIPATSCSNSQNVEESSDSNKSLTANLMQQQESVLV